MWIMQVETDDDFVIQYNDNYYTGEFFLTINDVDSLLKMKILSPSYTPKSINTKCWEFEEAVLRIVKNPNIDFDTTGGNRGVCWYKIRK